MKEIKTFYLLAVTVIAPLAVIAFGKFLLEISGIKERDAWDAAFMFVAFVFFVVLLLTTIMQTFDEL